MMVLITVVKITIVACTFVGNLFVIIAILIDKNLQTPANQLVLSLAVADLMVGSLVMPLGTYNDYHEGWWLGEEVCEFYTSADVLCCTASILNLLAIALDRYWAVTNVDYIYKRTWKRVTLMIVCAWTVGAIVSLAPIFGWKDPDFARRVLEDHKCLVSQDVGYQIFATISTFYAPLVLLLALYWRIFKVARKRIRCKPGRKSGGPQQLVATTSSSMFIGTAAAVQNTGQTKPTDLAKAPAHGGHQNHRQRDRTPASKVDQTIESIAQRGSEPNEVKATKKTSIRAKDSSGPQAKLADNFEPLCAEFSGSSSGAVAKIGDLTNSTEAAASGTDEGPAFACTVASAQRQRVANDRNNGPDELEPRLKGARRFEIESEASVFASVGMNEKQICLPSKRQEARVSMHHLGLLSSEVAVAATTTTTLGNKDRNSHQQGDQFLSIAARQLAGTSDKEADQETERHDDGAHLKNRPSRPDDRLKVSPLHSSTLAIQSRTKPVACADDVLRLLQRCAVGPNPLIGVETASGGGCQQPLATSFQATTTTTTTSDNNQQRQRQRHQKGPGDNLLSSASHLADRSANGRRNAGGSWGDSNSLCCRHHDDYLDQQQQQQQQQLQQRGFETRRSLVQLDVRMLTSSGATEQATEQQQSISNSLSECGHCCCCLNTSGGLTSDEDFDEHNDEVLELQEETETKHVVNRTMISLSQQADAAAAWRSGGFRTNEFLRLTSGKKVAPARHHCRQGSRTVFAVGERVSPMTESNPEQVATWRALSSMSVSSSSSSSATTLATSSSSSSRSILAAAAAAELDHQLQDFHKHFDESAANYGQTTNGAGEFACPTKANDRPLVRLNSFGVGAAKQQRPIRAQTQREPLDRQVPGQSTEVKLTAVDFNEDEEQEVRSTSVKSTRTSGIRRRFKALGQLVSFVQTSRQFNSSSSAQTSQSGDETTTGEQKRTGNRNHNNTNGDNNNNNKRELQHDSVENPSERRELKTRIVMEPMCEPIRSATKQNSLGGVTLRVPEAESQVDSPLASLKTTDSDQLTRPAIGNQFGLAAAPLALKAASSLPPQQTPLAPPPPPKSSQSQSMSANQFGARPISSAQQRRQNLEMKREKKAAKTLAIITGVFVCCWLPFFLNAIVMPICGEFCTPSDLILSVLLWLGYLNSLLNPIIYTIFSPDFRRAFHRLLCWPERAKSARRGGAGTGANTAKASGELATIKLRADSKATALGGRLA